MEDSDPKGSKRLGALTRIHQAAEESGPDSEAKQKRVLRHWQEGVVAMATSAVLTTLSPVATVAIKGEDGDSVGVFVACVACALSWFGFYRVLLSGDEAGRSGLTLLFCFAAFFYSTGYFFWVLGPHIFPRGL